MVVSDFRTQLDLWRQPMLPAQREVAIRGRRSGTLTLHVPIDSRSVFLPKPSRLRRLVGRTRPDYS